MTLTPFEFMWRFLIRVNDAGGCQRVAAATSISRLIMEVFMIGLRITRRGLMGGLAAGVAIAATVTSNNAVRAQATGKTYVLVPGAFCGAWYWRRVATLLEKQGHKVFPLTLTGLGDRAHLLSKEINLETHILDIVNFIEVEDLTDICLVAHSYGGYPASGALERVEKRVSSIVWVDALKPSDGQSFAAELSIKLEEGAISRPAPKTSALPDAKDAAWVVSKMTAHPVGTWLQPVKLSGARERIAKKTYIRLPKYQLAALDKAAAECKADSTWKFIENNTSGHAVMLQEPEWLAEVLIKAV
jgi:pimeloyl-ACP methyl ester carboxylesterase